MKRFLVQWTWRPDPSVVSHTFIWASSRAVAERDVKQLSNPKDSEHDGKIVEER